MICWYSDDGKCAAKIEAACLCAQELRAGLSAPLHDDEVVVPCVDRTENHTWVVSDENENICYCSRCGCMEY